MKKIPFTPLISLVLPIYNGERFLKESLESILNQTFKKFELIVVDDGSTDNSIELVKSYNDSRIRVIKNKRNLGSVAAINIALKNSKGKYIAVCTQDDISHPKRFEIEFNYLEKHPQIFLVGSSAIYINEGGKEIRRFRKYNHPKILAWRLRKSNGIIFPSIMFRNKDVIFNNHYEYHFYYRLLKRGEMLTNIPNFLVKYRVHSNAESVFDKERQDKLSKEVIEEFKTLRDPTNIIEKADYSFRLILHYLRTFKEKRLSKQNFKIFLPPFF